MGRLEVTIMRLFGTDPECPEKGAYTGKCHVCKKVYLPDHDALDGGAEGREAGARPQLGGVRCCAMCRHFFCDECRWKPVARAMAAAAHLVWPKNACCGPAALVRR